MCDTMFVEMVDPNTGEFEPVGVINLSCLPKESQDDYVLNFIQAATRWRVVMLACAVTGEGAIFDREQRPGDPV